LTPSGHTATNAAVIKHFLPVDYETLELGDKRWEVSLRTGHPPQ